MPDIVRKSTKATTDKIFIPDSTQSNPEEVSGIFASPVYIAGSTTTASNVTIVSSSLDYSTESAQIVGNTSLASINAKLPSLTAGNRLPVDIGGNGSITITSGNITVANEVEVRNDIGNPVPVNTQLLQPLTNSELRATPIPASVSSLPLPTGAATEVSLNTLRTNVEALLATNNTNITNIGSQSTFTGINALLSDLLVFQETLWTDNSGAFYVRRDVYDASTASFIAPVYLNTSNQIVTPGTGLRPVGGLQESFVNSINNKLITSSTAPIGTENVPIVRTIPSGSQTVNTGLTQPLTDVQLRATPVNITLPTNAATASNQTTANASLFNIDSKLPALVTGKVPVDIGTPAISITNTSLEVSNDAGNPIPISDAGGSITIDGAVSVANFPATQAISAVSLPLPTGAATSNNQATIINSIGGVLSNQLVEISALSSIDVKLPSLTGDNRIPVDINSATPLSTSITNDLPQIILDAINNSSGTFLIDGLVTEIVTALQSSLSVPVKKITSYEFYNVALTVGVYSTLPNQAATQVFIENQSTTSAARIRKVGGTNYITLNPGYGREFFVLSNLNELEALGDTANLTIEIETRN